MRLAGRVALVTGCGPNINGGIAYGLADEGAKLVMRMRVHGPSASVAAKRPRSCATLRASRSAAIAQAEAAVGPVDILVNGAMLQIRKGLRDVSLGEFKRQLDVGLCGACCSPSMWPA